MKAKLQTEDGKTRYKKRKQTVEPVFGIIKSAIGFTRFHLRGIQNVAEWLLFAVTYDCRRLQPAASLSQPMAAISVDPTAHWRARRPCPSSIFAMRRKLSPLASSKYQSVSASLPPAAV